MCVDANHLHQRTNSFPSRFPTRFWFQLETDWYVLCGIELYNRTSFECTNVEKRASTDHLFIAGGSGLGLLHNFQS